MKVNFTECGAETYACAILVGDLKSRQVKNGSATYNLIANFRDIKVTDCFNLKGKSNYFSVALVLSNGKVVIHDSSWRNSRTSTAGSLMMTNAGGKTDIVISGCTFAVNVTGGRIVMIKAQYRQGVGSVTIVNSVMSNHQIGWHGFWISPVFSIKMIKVVMASFAYALTVVGRPPKERSQVRPFYVSITNCSFLDNKVNIVALARDSLHVELSIENTVFRSGRMIDKKVGFYFIVAPLKVLNYSSADVKMHNVTFESSPCSILALIFQGNKTVQIQR